MVHRLFIGQVQVHFLLCSADSLVEKKVLINETLEALEGFNDIPLKSVAMFANGDTCG
jgi:hypothetical protein